MKPIFTLFIKVIAIAAIGLTTSGTAVAQCTAPVMTWNNASLISAAGTAGQVNAKYKFPSVTAGVDAIITITDIVGGASLTSIDDNTYGYAGAWQPVVHTKNNAGAGESYVAFRIDFVEASNNNQSHQYSCFALSFIDVDGDNDKVREFIETKNFDSYQIGTGSLLQMSQNDGFTRALGPVLNYPNLDTTSYPTNIVFKFTNKNKVQDLRIGSKVDNNFIPQDRYNLGYFQPIVFPATALPVKYQSFEALSSNNTVALKWITENEINNSHFEVERSLDGSDFKKIATIANGQLIAANSKLYVYQDNSNDLLYSSVVYYRIKQVDKDGKFSYTNVLMVRMGAVNNVKMQVSPNPFVENVNIRFTATQSGTALVQVLSVNGEKVQTQRATVGKGNNSIQVQGLSRLAPGVYIVQLNVNGIVTDNQKIIKN